jgi:hypothetical protein
MNPTPKPVVPRPVVPTPKLSPIAVKVGRDELPSGDRACWIRLFPGDQRLCTFGRRSFQAPARLPGIEVTLGEILISTLSAPLDLATALEEAAAKLRELA